MSFGRKSLTLVALVSTVGTTACNSGGSASSSCEAIDASGGIVSSADGTLSLSFRPGSVSESTEVCIAEAERPPNGPPNVYGQAYRVTPDISVDVNISITYRAPLPPDTSKAAVGVIRREDFDSGAGQWLALPITRLEPSNDLIAGTDTRISMFYGLVDDGGSGSVNTATTGTASTTASGSQTGSTDSETATTGAADDTVGSETDEGTTGSSDSNSNSNTNPTGETDGSTETSESESETGDPASCDNLPMGPFPITQIATLAAGGPEDLAMTGDGTFVLADGGTLVEMDGDGGTTDWLAGLPYNDDILGIRFDSNGTLYAAIGQNGTDLWSFTTAGSNNLFDTALLLPNAIHIDSDDQIWISDYFGDSISRIDPVAQTVVEVIGNNANTANGVFFDEQRGMLYWANYSQSQIWGAVITDGTAGGPIPIIELEGVSDGITMDECGNLYVVDQGGIQGDVPCRIDRIELDEAGQSGDVFEIAGAGDLGNGCANAQFGYGFGDSNDQAMFVTGQAGNVYRVEIGLSGYPITLPGG
ncbi:MAG: hypothetical protein KUG77_22350 [Nannocystaceae bacterium]|nr:hypothetical protein [Nannocystaceae bacterium]